MRKLILGLVAAVVATFGSVVASATPAHAVACWTTFDPPAPQGGAMNQTYKNCNGYSVWVTPYYRTSTGSYVVYQSSCAYVANGGSWLWHFSSTVSGVNYGTAFCQPPYPPYNQPEQSSATRCWTYFDPPAPQGGPMTQDYYDCGFTNSWFTPAYTTSNGSLWAYAGNCQKSGPPDPTYVFATDLQWYFPQTNHNVTYTTVFCAGEAR